jgi:hypothetical protein
VVSDISRQLSQSFVSPLPDLSDVTLTRTAVNPGAKDSYVDVIDRGQLSIETSTAMYVHWRDDMAPKCPLVSFSAGADVQEIRKTRPMTFLAILATASPVIQPSQQPALTTELSRQFSDRVFFHGDKSVDLIQALLLASQFYTRPHNARDMTFVCRCKAQRLSRPVTMQMLDCCADHRDRTYSYRQQRQ